MPQSEDVWEFKTKIYQYFIVIFILVKLCDFIDIDFEKIGLYTSYLSSYLRFLFWQSIKKHNLCDSYPRTQ